MSAAQVVAFVAGSIAFFPVVAAPAHQLAAPVVARYRYIGHHRLDRYGWRPGELTAIAARLNADQAARAAAKATRLADTAPAGFLFTHQLREVSRA